MQRPATRSFRRWHLFVPVFFLATPAAAAELPPSEEALDEVVVSGEQPGPGLWKLSHQDHVLYIMGTMSPLPAKMRWRSAGVEAAVAGSQQVIADIKVTGDFDVGLIQGVRLMRAALRARANPDGKLLQDVLPPATFARWSAAKQRYLKGNRKVERWRPMLAGRELQEAAFARSGLNRGVVWPVIERVARKHKVPIRVAEITLHIDDPAGLIRDFTSMPLTEDVRCLESLLLSVERDLPAQARRANAWAVGDIDALRADPPEDSDITCLNALTSTPRLAEELNAAVRRARQEWLLVAEGALLRNRQSFAVLSMRDLLRPDGLLAELVRRGYRVEAP